MTISAHSSRMASQLVISIWKTGIESKSRNLESVQVGPLLLRPVDRTFLFSSEKNSGVLCTSCCMSSSLNFMGD